MTNHRSTAVQYTPGRLSGVQLNVETQKTTMGLIWQQFTQKSIEQEAHLPDRVTLNGRFQ